MRTVVAMLEVDDGKAIAEDLGTIEYLEREFGWLEQSGISLDEGIIMDDDDELQWARYINYLVEWAFCHQSEKFDGSSPACYYEWIACERSD